VSISIPFGSYLSSPVHFLCYHALPLGTGRVTLRHRRADNTVSGRPLPIRLPDAVLSEVESQSPFFSVSIGIH